MAATLAILGLPGHYEVLILGVLGLLLFGNRLPEIGRSLGRGIVEFRKGIKGIESEIDQAGNAPDQSQQAPQQQAPQQQEQSTTP